MSGDGDGAAAGRTGRVLAVVAALSAATLLSGRGSALLAGGVGVLVFAVGLRNESTQVATLGTAFLLAGLLLAGTGAAFAGSAPAVAAAVLVALAWDLGTNAVGLRRDVPTGTRPPELVHAGASAVVLTGVGIAGYAVGWAAPGRLPAVGLVALLFAGVVAATLLRE